MKLELGIMAGAESKVWLADLTKVVERMEKAAGILSAGSAGAGKAKTTAAPDAEEEEDLETAAPEADADEDEDDFAPKVKKAAKKTAAAFDEDEDEEPATETESDDDADFTAPPAKPAKAAKLAKAKKLTIDDVNDACKAKAKSIGGKPGRDKVLAILMKHFKTESVSKLEPEQYAKCVELMAV